jgi:hypothetical protein
LHKNMDGTRKIPTKSIAPNHSKRNSGNIFSFCNLIGVPLEEKSFLF